LQVLREEEPFFVSTWPAISHLFIKIIFVRIPNIVYDIDGSVKNSLGFPTVENGGPNLEVTSRFHMESLGAAGRN
jgi:hypothetical protein